MRNSLRILFFSLSCRISADGALSMKSKYNFVEEIGFLYVFLPFVLRGELFAEVQEVEVRMKQ